MLSSVDENVVIGHADGVITIDLAEADDAHREQVRDRLDEPYRTMLGHLRHESGHYLSGSSSTAPTGRSVAASCSATTPSPTGDAIDRHYEQGPPADWAASTSPPTQRCTVRDFAETWGALPAHLRHRRIGGGDRRLIVTDRRVRTPFSRLVTTVWSPLSLSLA